jgi:hypothetical protein
MEATMSKQQTAVEWLEHMFEYGFVFERKQKEKIDSMFAHAKIKECEQIAKAWERRAMDVTGYDYYRLYHGKLPIGGDHE